MVRNNKRKRNTVKSRKTKKLRTNEGQMRSMEDGEKKNRRKKQMGQDAKTKNSSGKDAEEGETQIEI